jgi:hypothetical protein
LKKFILFFVLTVAGFAAKAQDGYNYYEWGIGGGIGYGRAYADTKRQDSHPIYNFNIASLARFRAVAARLIKMLLAVSIKTRIKLY